MHRWRIASSFVIGCVLLPAAEAQPQAQPVPPPRPQIQIQLGNLNGKLVMAPQIGSRVQLGSVSAIVVGRVIGMEPMDTEEAPGPGQSKAAYRIGVVQVSDTLYGLEKNIKMVRVGFLAAPANNVNGFGRAVLPGGGFPVQVSVRGVNLQVGQDGLYFLVKHPSDKFYILPNYGHFITSQNNSAYANEVKNARQLGKVMENPSTALKAADPQARYLGAAVLLARYRGNVTATSSREERIDAAESKLILKVLAEADWTGGRASSAVASPAELFKRLGVTANDGYEATANPSSTNQAMQKWLDENKDRYVIKRLVADSNAKTMSDQPVQAAPARNQQVLPRLAPRVQPAILPVAPAPLPVPEAK